MRCIYDTDGDGNCPYHPRGCIDAMLEGVADTMQAMRPEPDYQSLVDGMGLDVLVVDPSFAALAAPQVDPDAPTLIAISTPGPKTPGPKIFKPWDLDSMEPWPKEKMASVTPEEFKRLVQGDWPTEEPIDGD